MMPSFSLIALDRLLEPEASNSPSKKSTAPESNLEGRNTAPLNGDDSTEVPERHSVLPYPKLGRRNLTPLTTEKKAQWPKISPSLYATPASAPLPDPPTSFPPSPYIINHKRRGPRLIESFSEKNSSLKKEELEGNLVNGRSSGMEVEIKCSADDVVTPNSVKEEECFKTELAHRSPLFLPRSRSRSRSLQQLYPSKSARAKKMRAFCTSIRFPELLFLPKVNFPVTRIQVSFPAKVVFSCGKFELAESSIDGSSSLSVVPPTLLTAEKEEAKAILNLCLKKQGLSNAAASRAINKSDVFVDHLVSKLHSVHKSRYLVGRELTTLEIRDALSPYLGTLLEEHGNAFVDVVENFPNRPVERRSASPISSPTFASESKVVSDLAADSKKLRALARVSETVPAEKLPQHVVYLIELGLDLEKIQGITQRFPAFAYYSLEGKVRPVVEFLLDLGVPKRNIPIILVKRPQLCGISLSENLIPTMKYLESLGLDNKKWAKVLYRFPALLTYSRQKLKSTLDFLYEMGLSDESIGRVLTCCPNIISYSVEHKLRPTAEYFLSLGVDVSLLLHRSPQTFGLSIETNLKPLTEFFLERGYSLGDIGTMIQRYGALYTFSLANNLRPKWEFFLSMDYPRSELVKFPQYFGYSLEGRIKPRYALVRQLGVRLLLNQVLSLSNLEFHKVLKKKLNKMGDGKAVAEP